MITFKNKQRGISMLEVMIAILIFAFGMLGLVGLQLASLKYQKGAWARSGAATSTIDIGERIRSNAKSIDSYLTTGQSYTALLTPPSPSSCDQKVSVCTAVQVAANDMAAWATNVAATLPGGAGSVERVSALTDPAMYRVTLMWYDKNAVDNSGGALVSEVCGSTATTNCCPSALGVTPGIRCVNSVLTP